MSNQPNPALVQECINRVNARYKSRMETCERNRESDLKRARDSYAQGQKEADDRKTSKIAACDTKYTECMSSAGSGGSGVGSVGLGGFFSEQEKKCRADVDECKAEAEAQWQTESANRLAEFVDAIKRAEESYNSSVLDAFNTYTDELRSCIQTGHSGVVDGIFDIIGSIIDLGGMLKPTGLEGVNAGGVFTGRGVDFNQ